MCRRVEKCLANDPRGNPPVLWRSQGGQLFEVSAKIRPTQLSPRILMSRINAPLSACAFVIGATKVRERRRRLQRPEHPQYRPPQASATTPTCRECLCGSSLENVKNRGEIDHLHPQPSTIANHRLPRTLTRNHHTVVTNASSSTTSGSSNNSESDTSCAHATTTAPSPPFSGTTD